MNEQKKGYHITLKNNLYNIQKNGLEPRIGRRSNTVDEYTKLLFFSTMLNSILIWKDRLYKNISFDELAILVFDLEGMQYEARYDSAGDFFTKTIISPENIRLLQIVERDAPQNTVSLEHLKDIFSSNGNDSDYELSENHITELSFEKPTIDSDKKRRIIEKLAEYEHKKWSEEYSKIVWKAEKDDNGNLVISEQDVEQIRKYSSLHYDKVEDFYKKEIRKTIMETFFIMQENNMTVNMGISSEELISILEHIEFMRRNRWSQYMLSMCSQNNGSFMIQSEKAKLWESEMRIKYGELSEQQKEAYKKEVFNIFQEIHKSILTKRTNIQSSKGEIDFMRLDEDENLIE